MESSVPQSIPHVPQSVPHVPQSVPQIVPHAPQSVPHVPHDVPQDIPDTVPNVPQSVIDKINLVVVDSSDRSLKHWFNKRLAIKPITSETTTVLKIPVLKYDGLSKYIPMKEKMLLAQMRNVRTVSPVEHLTFYTQNVWFDTFNQRERYEEIISVISTAEPDFVCLQEVITPLVHMLKGSGVVQRTYYMSGNLINGYGVMILSKWPCLFSEVRYDQMTFMSRSLLCCQTVINGHHLVVNTTHLESCFGNAQYRIKQLGVLFAALKCHENVLVMGDFNYVAEWKEEQSVDRNFKDLFKYADSLKVPYTHLPRRERIDRMLMKSSYLTPTPLYHTVGLTPCPSFIKESVLDQDGRIKSLSDHLGIIAVVKCS